MGWNEIETKIGPPQSVRLSEWLGLSLPVADMAFESLRVYSPPLAAFFEFGDLREL